MENKHTVSVNIPVSTMQRLVDFAHAAMDKRPEVPDDYPIIRSRLGADGHAVVLAGDLRAVQQCGEPSWASAPRGRSRVVVKRGETARLCWVQHRGAETQVRRWGLLDYAVGRVVSIDGDYDSCSEAGPCLVLREKNWERGVPVVWPSKGV